jgi:ABC-2 type transport system ATP-binding protein
METMLECTSLTKSYGKNEAVNNLDLILEEDTVYGL